MSSKPSKEGVDAVKRLLRDYKHLAKREAELLKLLEELPKVQEEIRRTHSDVIKKLDQMDVKADGNTGWESRVLWFLCELDKQSSEDPS